MNEEWIKYRQIIMGLVEQSSHKSYSPELMEKLDELESAQMNLVSIINNISDGIIIHDGSGQIHLWNHSAKKIFNCTDDDKVMTGMLDFSPEDEIRHLISLWNEALLGKTKVTEWHFHQLHSRKKMIVHVSINKTMWNGKAALVSVLRDFSAQKKHETELIKAWKKAEESDRLKSAFLANLSHEIRTPMNAIMGFTEFLKKPDLTSDKRQSYITIVHESGRHLLSILDDIIEISKIETGQISPNLTPVHISNTLQEIYRTLKISIPKNKDIQLKLNETLADPGLTVRTDRVKLSQILTNLINNAIKYTESGFITIGCRLADGDHDIEFSIADTGEGIEKKYHDIIFDRFSRLDSELATKMGGSGLGLAICKAYVDMLGGIIKLESVPGKGSVFTFTIPLIPVEEKHSEIVHKVSLSQYDGNNELILIAEDDDINYLFFTKLFSSRNYRLLRARNGREAVDLALGNPHIHLVLMDIKMPVMNGIAALKMIRQKRPSLPVIAQTAHALPDETKSILSEGFDGYISKPIDELILFETIYRILHP